MAIQDDFNQESAEPDSTMTVDGVGNKHWHNKEGHYHRTDGPAFEGAYGRNTWWLNGQRHRADGPAIEDGSCRQWYVHNQAMTEAEFNTWRAREEERRKQAEYKAGWEKAARECIDGLPEDMKINPPVRIVRGKP